MIASFVTALNLEQILASQLEEAEARQGKGHPEETSKRFDLFLHFHFSVFDIMFIKIIVSLCLMTDRVVPKLLHTTIR